MRIRTVRKDSLEGLNVIVKVASSAPKWNMVSRQHASGHQRSSVWSDGSPPTRGCVDIYRRLAMTETLYSLFRMRTTMTKPVFEFHDTISHMHSWCLLYEGMVFLLAWVTLNWAPVQDNWGKYHSRPKRYFRLIAPRTRTTTRAKMILFSLAKLSALQPWSWATAAGLRSWWKMFAMYQWYVQVSAVAHSHPLFCAVVCKFRS